MSGKLSKTHRWICIILIAIELISLLLLFSMHIWFPIARESASWLITLVIGFVYLACYISLIPIQPLLGVIVLFCEKNRKNRICHLLLMISTVAVWIAFWYVMTFFVM